MRVKRSGQFHGIAGRSATAVADDARPVAQEIRGLDHERIAFPMTARVAHIRADVGTRMRAAVDRNYACFVDHLLHDGHKALALHDLLSVAVDNGKIEPGTPRLM